MREGGRVKTTHFGAGESGPLMSILALDDWAEFGLSRFSTPRGLDTLERAGLVSTVRRSGRSPVVTILDAADGRRPGLGLQWEVGAGEKKRGCALCSRGGPSAELESRRRLGDPIQGRFLRPMSRVTSPSSTWNLRETAGANPSASIRKTR